MYLNKKLLMPEEIPDPLYMTYDEHAHAIVFSCSVSGAHLFAFEHDNKLLCLKESFFDTVLAISIVLNRSVHKAPDQSLSKFKTYKLFT